MRLVTALLFGLLLTACKPAVEIEVVAEKGPLDSGIKHLVLIAIDTVRADTFFAPDEHNFKDRLSPWLESARVYTQAQSVSPWTIPTVATVLTGYLPNQHGAGSFPTALANLDLQTPTAIHSSVKTLPERLSEVGFRARAASSHPWLSVKFGLQRGFRNVTLIQSREEIDAWFKSFVGNWQASKINQRNFAYLHYMEAHQRHTSKFNNGAFADLTNEQIQRGLDWSKLDACKRGTERKICQQYIVYTNAVLDLRDSIANTLEVLETNGFLKNTLVVIYSDHGEEFHDHWAEAVADKTDPRGVHGFGHGNSMYQELLRVPLLIWNPADNKGRIVDNPVSLVDIAPSALNWLNVDIGEDKLTGLLFDDAEKLSERAVFASHMAYGPEQVAVREGSKKSIWNTVNDSLRFFDLAVDQNEKKAIESDDLVMLFDQLNYDYFEMGSNGVGVQPEINEEQLAHLKAIGYLQGAESNNSSVETTPGPVLNISDISNAGTVEQTETIEEENDDDDKNHE